MSGKPSKGPPRDIEKKPKLSKAERRALQEAQRATKAAGGGKGGSGGGKGGVHLVFNLREVAVHSLSPRHRYRLHSDCEHPVGPCRAIC
mmetsp:Transcript_24331/g.37644  ORF Transcript_24331/g.37644 Transcript_24331/m.37644 type:complete len:89 (+) Transcript_24331:51-317(+)